MFSVIVGQMFGPFGVASHAARRAAAENADLRFYAALLAGLVFLNLYLAIRHWRPYWLILCTGAAIVASLLMLAGLFLVAEFFGLVIWIGMLVVLLTLFVQLPRARRRATLDLLTLAIEKQMPLPPVIRALAADQGGSGRLLRMADNLERGMPLSRALEADPGLLPRQAVVAAKMGEATGNLAAAFRQVEANDVLSSPVRQALLGHTFYLVSLAFFVPVVVAFVTIFILPKFISIFDEFGIALPKFTVWTVRFLYSFYWLGICLPIIAAALLIYVILCYVKFWPLPTMGWSRRFKRGRVLRAMSLATDAQRPLGETLTALARSYPRSEIRRNLQACADETLAGANWNISMLKHGLIGVQDAALVDAA
ncbi:MAG TPA: type II secretion system F family protein, partial [Pirellulales bacterium]